MLCIYVGKCYIDEVVSTFLCLCKASHRHLDSLDFEKQHKMKNINNHHSLLAFRTFMYFGQCQTASCMLLFMFGTFLKLQSLQHLE